jgi:cytochrome c peroxidase
MPINTHDGGTQTTLYHEHGAPVFKQPSSISEIGENIMKSIVIWISSTILLLTVASTAVANGLTAREELGKSIFFDVNLSFNGNQACASCHGPEVGFTGPESDTNTGGAVYEGSIAWRFGNRKPPSAAYATLGPILGFVLEKANNKNKKEELFFGGNFWDGRATGEKLGNPAADQAQGPFLNPLEQGLSENTCVVYRVCNSSDYADMFDAVYPGSCNIVFPAEIETLCATGDLFELDSFEEQQKVEKAYDEIALAIAAYEGSSEVNQFSSKYDAYLAGMAELTKQEKNGLNLFKSAGECAHCHVLDPGSYGEAPLLTDFTFDNLGVPRNPENPFYSEPLFNPDGFSWVDMGLGNFLHSRMEYAQYAAQNYGKQKVPTLRNVDKRPYPGFVKAYTHNGYFKTLKQVVNFYNTRDVKPVCTDNPLTDIDESLFTPVEEAMAQGCWPEPEVATNVNTSELGNLHLTDAQEDDIVAFLKTLSDGYVP